MEVAKILGRVTMSSKVNEPTNCEVPLSSLSPHTLSSLLNSHSLSLPVSASLSVEQIGLNLNHPKSFPQIEKRVRYLPSFPPPLLISLSHVSSSPSLCRETVAVDSFQTNIEVVRKLDPRGSLFVTAPLGISDNLDIIQFALPSPLPPQSL
jgi:hypothetical protein